MPAGVLLGKEDVMSVLAFCRHLQHGECGIAQDAMIANLALMRGGRSVITVPRWVAFRHDLARIRRAASGE
jgi:hypothetical protein